MLPRVNPRPARRASPSSNARPVPELSKTATCSPRAQRLRARPTGGPPACLQRRAPNPGCAVTTRGQSPHPLASQHKQATTQAPALCPSVGMRARVGPRATLHSPAPQSLGTSVRLALKTLRGAGSLATLGLARRLRCTGTPSLSHEPRSAVQHALPSWSEPTPARTGAPPSTQPPARTQAHKLPPDSSASQPALIDDHSQSPCVGSPAAGHPPPRY